MAEVGTGERLQVIPRVWTHHPKDGVVRRDVGDVDVMPRRVLAHPVQIAHGRCGRRNHPVAGLCKPGDRDVRFDAAAFIQPLAVNDFTGRHIHVRGAQAIEVATGVGAADRVFGKARLIE